MKKTMLFLFMASMLVACNNEKKEAGSGATTTTVAAKPEVKFPLPVDYTQFEPGNPEYAAMILQGSWKDWEENKLDKSKWLTDTVTAFHSDNTVSRGADSLMARWKRQRALYSSSVPQVAAVMSVYAPDKKENWVLIWADEFDTKLDGTKDTTAVMEGWRINKDGKADLLLQYDRAKRKQ